MKFLIEDARIIIVLINIIGDIIKFAFAITFKENLLQIMLLIVKKSVIKSIGDVLKYMVLNVSDKFFMIEAVSITSSII